MMPSSNRQRNVPFARQFILAVALFLPPCLFIHENEHLWISKLSLTSERPTLKDASILVKGFSAPSTYPQQRVALCITGHLRSFYKPSVHVSIKRNVIDALRDAGYSVDIFFHVGKSDAPREGKKKAATYLFAHILSSFSPVKTSFYKNSDRDCPKTHCRNADRSVCPYALIRLSQCLTLIEEYENRTGIDYDWIYKTRPDIAFGARISTPDELEDRYLYTNQHTPGASVHAHQWLRKKFKENAAAVGSPLGDHVIAASRKVAAVAFKAYSAFEECGLYDLPSGTINAEVGLTYWLVRRNIHYRTLPWFWMLVRDKEGPECERLVYVRVDTDQFLEKCNKYRDSGRIPD
ncbi:unnamed protein product [Agarophyton chilense]